MFDCGEIVLRELRESDLEGEWYTWFNDPYINKFQDKGIYPNSIEKQKDYYKYLLNSNKDIVMAIEHKDDKVHIGNIGLHKIHYVHRNCEIGIVIGNKKYLNKGYSKIVISKIKEYAFKTLNLNKIFCIIMLGNTASYKAFKSCGFEEEAHLKNHFFKNGKYLDAYILSIFNKNL